MARKKNKGLIHLVLTVVGIATAVLTFVGLGFNFVTHQVQLAGVQLKPVEYGLADWFDLTNQFQESENIAGWQVARIFLIITLVLVGTLSVLLLLRLLFKSKALYLATVVVGVVTILAALTFFIALIVGCGALSDQSDFTNSYNRYTLNVAAYWVTALALITAGLAAGLPQKK